MIRLKKLTSLLILLTSLLLFFQNCVSEDSIIGGVVLQGGTSTGTPGVESLRQSIEKAVKIKIREVRERETHSWSCPTLDQISCEEGVKIIDYAGCGLGFKLYGILEVEYSNTSCSEDIDYSKSFAYDNVSLVNLRGQVLSIDSANHKDYRGVNFGGGTVYEFSSESSDIFNIESGSRIKFKDKDEALIFDLSSRTIVDYQYLAEEGSFTIVKGDREISENLKKWTVVHKPRNLYIDTENCCYPESGSMQSVFSGSIQGTATTEFLSCGKVKFTFSGKSEELNLDACR